LTGIHRNPAIDQINDVFQVAGGSSQPVDVPDQQVCPAAFAQASLQLLIARSTRTAEG
jgi:hypothetical protein